MNKLNNALIQIKLLNAEYEEKIEKGSPLSEVNERINSVITQTLLEIKQYLAVHPANLNDLQELIHLRDELNRLDISISKKGVVLLNQLVEKISIFGGERALFTDEAAWGDKIKFVLEKFKSFFVGKIRNKINQQIFFVWNQRLRYRSTLEKRVKLNEKILSLEEKLAKKPEDTKLTADLAQNRADLERAENFIVEYERNQAVGSETRQLLKNIGGTRVALQTKDRETVDGFYLSAQNFQQKCLEVGAQSVTLTIGQTVTSGLILPTGKTAADQFMQDLTQLKLFKDFAPDTRNKGAGWSKITIEGQIIIIPDFEVEHLQEKGDIIDQGNGNYLLSEQVQEEMVLEVKPLEFSPEQSGTVVLGMGAAGLYEMYKREALSLLMQGVNVMLFNHRGQGESSGKPSEKGTYEDMETVYQYLKQIHHVEDNKLVLRGLCLSGGIVAELAAHHPQVNIILDQTYADIADLSLNTVLDSLKDSMQYNPEEENSLKKIILNLLTPILRAITSLVSPSYSTINHLRRIEGKVLILRTTEDTYTSREMTDKIVDAYASHSPSKAISQIRIGHMPGIHGSTWLDSKKSDEGIKANLGRYHMFSFLQENGILNPFVDRGTTLKTLKLEYEEYLNAKG